MSAIGLRVGPFEIVDEARVPEPGAWYVARRTGLTRKQPTEVLVKLLPPDADPEERAKLQHEFERLRALEDKRVPQAVAFYEGIGALAVDARTGVSLGEVVDARHRGEVAMTPATLLDVLLELAETIQHVHHKGRWHGHLSPEVTAVASDGSLWLFGFGAGPATQPDAAWLAPERARGEASSQATDQWSLGAMAASLITGIVPWEADDAVEAQNLALRGDNNHFIDPVERQWPALGRLLRRMTDPHAAHRFPSMHPIRQELLALARRAGGTSERRELGARMARTYAPRAGDEPIPTSFSAVLHTELPVAVVQFEPTVVEDDSPTAPNQAPQLSPAPAPTPVATPARLAAPDPSFDELPGTDDPSSDTGVPMEQASRATPAPRPRVHSPLPSEPLPVVRPTMPTADVPTARRSNSHEPDPDDEENEEATLVMDSASLRNNPDFAAMFADDEPTGPREAPYFESGFAGTPQGAAPRAEAAPMPVSASLRPSQADSLDLPAAGPSTDPELLDFHSDRDPLDPPTLPQGLTPTPARPSQAPAVRPQLAAKLGSVDHDSEPTTFARHGNDPALAAALASVAKSSPPRAKPSSPPWPGERPTVVPPTDPGADPNSDFGASDEWEAESVDMPMHRSDSVDMSTPPPAAVPGRPQRAPRDSAGLDMTRIAPVLVGVMLALMLLYWLMS